jgi:branched-chain amino acid transport system substrate-binding protein
MRSVIHTASAAVTALLVLGACATKPTSNVSAMAARSVALLSAESGPVAALDGPAQRGAAVAFAADGDGHPGALPPLHVVDTQSTASGAARAAEIALQPRRFHRDMPEAAVGFGFTDTDVALGGLPAFASAGVPFVVIGATAPDLAARGGDGVFLACWTDDVQARAAADVMRRSFGTRAAIVFDSRSTFSRAVSGPFRQHFGTAGGSIPHEFDLAATPPTQLGAFLAGIGPQVDAMYVACEPGDVAPVLEAIRRVLPEMPVMGADSFDCPASGEVAGAPADRIWFTTHAWFGEGAPPEALTFATRYQAMHGVPPDSAFAALGFDAATIVRRAWDAAADAGRAGDPVAIREALAAVRDHRGASGVIDYAGGRVPRKDVWIVRVSGGRRSLVEAWRDRTGR